MKIYTFTLSETTRRAMIKGIYDRVNEIKKILDHWKRYNKKVPLITLNAIEQELLTLQTEVKKLL
jgi:adenine C2-methylase RlmN of 23S rRNA A2503 and tRNA A37